MRLIRHPASVPSCSRGSVVALGSFDGFHLGHQQVVARAVEMARRDGRVPAGVAFHPPSAVSYDDDDGGGALTPLRDLLSLLDRSGVDLVVLRRLGRRSAAGIDDSTVRRLLGALNARAVVVARETLLVGDADIAADSRRFGVAVEVVPPVTVGGAEVTRASVRDALRAADLASVERLLGRAYAISGRVVHGHQRGKGLGIPTANLRPRGMELPPDGVYGVWADLSGRRLAGVANVGRKPTFGDLERTIEVHILDFDEDLYGKLLRVEFRLRLRGEIRFPSVEALLEQIRTDIARARLALASA